MKFGIFYEHRLPRPWAVDAEEMRFGEALEQVALADRLGIDFAWELEHHFLDECAQPAASDVFLAAASQRTRTIRLGYGAGFMPSSYNHPGTVADRAAVLDLVSNGRVDIGVRHSVPRPERGGNDAEVANGTSPWRDAVEQLANMLVMDAYPGFSAPEWRIPPCSVVPKPVQKPHPPLWLACDSRESVQLAARTGLGAILLDSGGADDLADSVAVYYDSIRNHCQPIGHTVNANVAVVLGLSIHQDEQIAVERGLDGMRFLEYAKMRYRRRADQGARRMNLWTDYLAARDRLVEAEDRSGTALVGSTHGAIGTPAQVRDVLRSLAAAGVDQALFMQQIGDNRHDHICDSLRLFAETVMPEFHAGEAEHERSKAAALGGAIDAALARKAAAGAVSQPVAERKRQRIGR